MIKSIALLAFYDLILTLSQVDYVCRPFKPTEECEESRYEFKVVDVTEKRRPEIASGTAKCLTTSGRFIIAHDASMTVRRLQPMREEFEKLTLPAKQTEACRYD